MPAANGFIHVGSTDSDLLAGTREPPCKDRRRTVSTVPTQSRLLLNRIRMGHEDQHVAEGSPLCITIEANDNHVFAMAIDRITYEGNQTIYEELRFIDNNGGGRFEFGPLQDRAQATYIHCACRNGRAIMIDNRRHCGLIAIVNISCNHKNIAPQTSIAAYNALDLGGLTGKHRSNNNAEAHRTGAIDQGRPQSNLGGGQYSIINLNVFCTSSKTVICFGSLHFPK